jgi:hypothetical protein
VNGDTSKAVKMAYTGRNARPQFAVAPPCNRYLYFGTGGRGTNAECTECSRICHNAVLSTARPNRILLCRLITDVIKQQAVAPDPSTRWCRVAIDWQLHQMVLPWVFLQRAAGCRGTD